MVGVKWARARSAQDRVFARRIHCLARGGGGCASYEGWQERNDRAPRPDPRSRGPGVVLGPDRLQSAQGRADAGRDLPLER